MSSTQDHNTAGLWPERIWSDSPADLAESPAWELRGPRGPLTQQQIAQARGPVILAVVAAACVALGLVVSWRGEAYESSAGFWPPAGAALVALVVVPVQRWGWVVTGISVPSLLGIATGVVEPVPGIWWMVGNVVEPLFAASVILWFAWSPWLTRIRLFVVFCAMAVLAGPMVGGAIGAVGTSIGYDEPWFDVWIHWVVTDGLGVLIVTPLLITLTPHRPLLRSRSGGELGALVLLIATLCGLTFIDIGPHGAVLLPYVILVGLVWAGMRFGTRAVAMAGMAVALAANLAIASDIGPFAESSSATARLTLPIFLMIALCTALMVALMAGDLANRDEVEGLLRLRATHDDLTGLPNRVLFADRLDRALDGTSDEDHELAVLLIDLDDFKKINDRHGHLVGDTVLGEVATRLRRALSTDDVLARFGGDEFVAMIARGGRVDELSLLAQRVAEALDAPMEVEGGDVYTMSCSIGVVRSTDADRRTSTDMLRCADIALNQAKGTDGRIAFYDEVLEARTQRQFEIAQEFPNAVERGEIFLVYQPLVSLRSGRVREFEALARWTSRRFGPVGPDEFVLVAERTGLMGPFGDFVLQQACSQLVEWRKQPGGADLRVAVNVSARQLCDLNFPDRVAAILDRTSLPADALTIEITETAIMDDLEVTARVLRSLRDLGLRLALDDFGTGYSSMTNLRMVELDTLKIDRSFVDGLGDVAGDTAIVRSIINLGHSFGLTVVAEGVETEDQAAALLQLGCDDGQGYLWSRPVAATEAANMVGTAHHVPAPAASV